MKRRPERIALRVIKGGLAPADDMSRERLRARGYRVGDVVFAEIRKPRRPAQHRKAHLLGKLIADNVEDFAGMDAHSVLKRLQLESGVGCEEIGVRLGEEMAAYRVPLSLSFESMDEGEFIEVYRGLCNYVARRYWPGLDAGRIEEMAELMPGSVA